MMSNAPSAPAEVSSGAEGTRKVTLTGSQMAELYVQGVSGEEIAARAGCTPGRVTQLVKAATGMTPRQCRLAHGWVTATVPPELADRIARACLAAPGKPLQQIAEDLEVPLHQVSSVVAARRLDRQRTRRRVLADPAEVRQVARAYRRGKTTVALAAEYGTDESVIRRRLDEARVTRRGRGPARPDAEVAPLVVAAWAEQRSFAHVYRATGVSARRARRLLAQAGVDLP